ncbi:DUF924 family protein [Enterococcus lemanii]|uniref:DUF924 family protein n=1 Tax=Enterococcus lemanii TaxID=1159752 RepID=A0ABV9MWZ5_9ENTE|nr:DUF924 family protein [Enterococcus lemanii]MBM7709857.1 uncharacterized protein (DUF924 family) [Enterococcus lemanii]
MDPQVVLDFWFKETPAESWFNGGTVFDQTIITKFGALHQAASQGELAHWRQSIHGYLAEIILLDQFSRNIYRNQAQAFAYDGMALILAQEALKRTDLKDLTIAEKGFLIMPFMHSESLKIHQEYAYLFEEPGLESRLKYEKLHVAIIERFGRYPHRNQVLGRTSSSDEIAFLQEPNSSF